MADITIFLTKHTRGEQDNKWKQSGKQVKLTQNQKETKLQSKTGNERGQPRHGCEPEGGTNSYQRHCYKWQQK